jgi:helicase
MHSNNDRSSLGEALAGAIDAVLRNNADQLVAAAEELEILSDEGGITKKWETVALAFSGLSYDAAGESIRARRPYLTLLNSSSSLPVAQAFQSEELAKAYTRVVADFGLRRLGTMRRDANMIFDYFAGQKRTKQSPPVTDDYLLSLGLLDLLVTYSELFSKKTEIGQMALKIQAVERELGDFDAASWLVILSRLLLKALNTAVRRNILNFGFPESVKQRLIQEDVFELWKPQVEAIAGGLLTGQNLVYSTPPGTGKSFLAYIASGDSSPTKKTVYVVPTRTLALEAYASLSNMMGDGPVKVAISTRDATSFDDRLDEVGVLVSTYEKFDALLKRRKLDETSVKRAIIDEVHYITDEDRGPSLELTMTKLKVMPKTADPQIITLSGMLLQKDSNQFSAWLGGNLVRDQWKPVDTEELVLFNGNAYTKDGQTSPSRYRTNANRPDKSIRIELLNQIAKDIISKGGQCLVAVESRRGVEELAEEIASALGQASFLPDLDAALVAARKDSILLRDEIRDSEPEMTVSAKKLTNLLSNGVVYHHAGLPLRFRRLIEEGIRQERVKIVVSTTTFEAGVNLPFSHVIIPFPRGMTGKRPMAVNTYKNLAGRAGRPGHDRKGVAILLATSEVERDGYLQEYLNSEGELLQSGFWTLLNRRPRTRAAVQAQVLDESSRKQVSRDDVTNYARQTWFWNQASRDNQITLESHFLTEIDKLRQYGFISFEPNGEFEATKLGKIANNSALSPLSMKNILGKTRRIVESKLTGEKLDLLFLSLVALPLEVEGNDDTVNRVSPENNTAFIEGIIKLDTSIGERYQRIEHCRKYATLLMNWIKPLPIEEVLNRSGLDPTADAAMVEESLPRDAFWILSTVASIPNDVSGLSPDSRRRLKDLATFCKTGSSDKLVIEIMDKSLQHLGRNTAIRIADYLRRTNKTFDELREEDLVSLFPTNQQAAKLLYEEISRLSS